MRNPMSTLVFESSARAPRSAPERADVACFVGLAPRRPGTPVPADIQRWLAEQGWSSSDQALLADVPVPVERWETYTQLFEPAPATTYLGAAVRSFFAQGGRKCYVVRAGNPWPAGSSRTVRLSWLPKLLRGQGTQPAASPEDRGTWHGAAHVFGLPDVSFLALPDLAATVAADEQPPAPPMVAVPTGREPFVECSHTQLPPEVAPVTGVAPRCDVTGYQHWADFLERVLALLRRHARHVQLVSAIPLPLPKEQVVDGAGRRFGAVESPYSFLLATGVLPRLQSAFLQLVYPWVQTPGSVRLPEGLESPEGVLTGVLARNTLLQGTFRSALGQELAQVQALYPLLERSIPLARPPSAIQAPALSFQERVSLLGVSPRGPKVLSDVTTSPSATWRQAGLNRLFSVLVRAVSRVGLELLFEPSSERTWRALVRRLETTLVALWEVGALRGANPREAFRVRCDRTTMSQADIDAGRLVAELELDAAPAIERIRITLTVAEGGAVSLNPQEAA